MLTVIFATHNGAETLPAMLGAMTELTPPMAWQLVAVDNASTDESANILASFKARLPLRILREPRRGKNRALNLALAHIKGDLVVFTDDDVLPQPDWLTQLAECAAAHSDFDVFGGRILPHWTAEPDPLVLHNASLGVTYALTSDDQSEGAISPNLVWGPNMAVRRRVFDAGHRFNEAVGPGEGNYVMGSETEFTNRVHDAGYRSWFCDMARVKHIIREKQLEPAWVISRAYRFGRSQWTQESKNGFSVPCIIGIPRWRFAALLQECGQWLSSWLRKDKDQLFRARWELQFLKGYISEGLRSRCCVAKSGESR